MKPTKLTPLVLMLVLFGAALAQPASQGQKSKTSSTETAPMLLPGNAQIDAALKRTFGYDPSLSWQILDIHPSIAPGIAEVVVSFNKQPPYRFWITPDGQNAAVVADIFPFGSDPFAPAREKLQSAKGPSR